MIQATGKRYKYVSENVYEEDSKGANLGAEWLDENGNTICMLWAYTPTFNPSAKYAEMLYKLFVKPIGRDKFLLDQEIIDQLGVNKFFYGNFPSENFGRREPEPFDENGDLKEGLLTQVQFFIDNIIVNEHDLPFSFKTFIYQFISATQNVEII